MTAQSFFASGFVQSAGALRLRWGREERREAEREGQVLPVPVVSQRKRTELLPHNAVLSRVRRDCII